MDVIQTLRVRGERYVKLAKYAVKMIAIGVALIAIVTIGELIASGFPLSSIIALFDGKLFNDISYLFGLIGDLVGVILVGLGIVFKSNEDKGLMMLGIAMTYENTNKE